jgi:HSP20 family protein
MAKNQVADHPQTQMQSQTEPERSVARRNYYYPFPSGDFFSMNPFATLREMTREMSDFMDRSLSGGPFQAIRGHDTGAWSPTIEVREKDNHLIVSADLPGIDPKDVMVEVDNGVLVIRGERHREHTEQHEGYRRTERSYGSFHRAIPLPEGARTDDAKAEFRNGVLEIKVPVEEARSHRRPIPIQSGNWASGASGGSQR